MATPSEGEGAPSAGHPSGLPGQSLPELLWSLVVEGLAALGTVLIGGLMLIICADIVARNLFGGSLPLVSELGALLLVMIVALQLAATVRADRLARTELFIVPFTIKHPRAGALVSALFNLAGAAMVGGMAWATISVLEKDWDSFEFIGTHGLGTLPTWPFRALILLGLAIAAVEFAFKTVRALRAGIRAPEQGS